MFFNTQTSTLCSYNGKKYYTVIVHKEHDKDIIRNFLNSIGKRRESIPDRSVKVEDLKNHSKTRATYLLTDEEAELLKNHGKVKSINIDRSFHREASTEIIEYEMFNFKDRSTNNPNSFRDLQRFKNISFKQRNKIKSGRKEVLDTRTPAPLLFDRYHGTDYPLYSVHGIDSLSATQPPRTYPAEMVLPGTATGQLLRLQQKENPWITNNYPPSTFIEQTLSYYPFKNKGAGEDVDFIVLDSGVFLGHPEFNEISIPSITPKNYVKGNALRQIPQSNGATGSCQVLDIILDSPALIDPDYFYGDLINEKTFIRFDGTRVPYASAAIDWWGTNQLSARSAKFVSPSNGGSATGNNDFGKINYGSYEYFNRPLTPLGVNPPGNYSRDLYYGDPLSFVPAFSYAKHGTKVAGLAYGRTQGYAYNSNKWSLVINSRGGDDWENAFDVIKVFHKIKPTPIDKTEKNPTVVTSSVGPGYGQVFLQNFFFKDDAGNKKPFIYSTFRGVTTELPAPSGDRSTLNQYLSSMQHINSEMVENSISEAGKEMIESGVFFFQAGKNSNTNVVDASHPNYNNFLDSKAEYTQPQPYATTSDGTISAYMYSSRRGMPEQIGKTSTGEYPVILVGALDDTFYQNKELKAYYSNSGNGIDLWAPADGTMTATKKILGSKYSDFHRSAYVGPTYLRKDISPYPGALSAVNERFDGTSAATPVAAGFCVTLIANHRNWIWSDLKSWIKNELVGQPKSTFLNEVGDPSSPDDPAWNWYPDNERTQDFGSRGIYYPEGQLPKIPYLTDNF